MPHGIVYQLGKQMEMPKQLALVPWKHHVAIAYNCCSLEESLLYFPDMVFYHYRQKRFVVVELKVVNFKPEFAGKLNFYVKAADELLRGEDDNKSVGLLICKNKDKTTVEWALSDINKPLGVASYEIEQIVEHTISSKGRKEAIEDGNI